MALSSHSRKPGDHLPVEQIEKLLDSISHLGSVSSQSSSSTPRPPGEGCPPVDCWQKICTHQVEEEEARTLIEHGSQCQPCGALLHDWSFVLAPDETPEETLALSSLASSSSRWQQQMARQLLKKSSTLPRQIFLARSFLIPAVIGFAGTLAAALLLVAVLHRPRPSPEGLLAAAYTGRRVMDARIPLAAYAPLDAGHHQPAVGHGPTGSCVPMLEARAAIASALNRTPEDPHWLLLEARFDLLDRNYSSAMDTLQHILTADPTNVAALTDLASAYSMRAQATDSPANQTTALDYLEQAARLDPRNPVVLYNEAVVMQDLCLFNNAVDTWNKFLAVEPNKPWLEDGKRRLADSQASLAQIKKNHTLLGPFLKMPQGILHLARSPSHFAV